MKSFKEVLEILHKSGYIKSQLKNNGTTDLEFMSLGTLLLQNIQNEWIKNKSDLNIYFEKSNYNSNCDESSDYSINFLKTQNFLENFSFIKDTFQKELPLAIKTFLTLQKFQDFKNGFNLKQEHLMICDYFFSESQAYEKFSKIQRERKIWWMKFSTDPGRFHLSELKTEFIKKNKLQSVKIKAKYNFGDIDLENLYVIPMKTLGLDNVKDFHITDRKLNKKVIPVVIHSEVCSETAAAAFLFDAVEISKSEKICLQRNIAPYQCSIFCLFENDERLRQELEDLIIHLSILLRKSNIRTLNLSKSYVADSKSLNKELNQIDKIGVPYSIILDSTSLQNGLMKLRNRDTTISERIHISDVPNYLVKIFNSF